METIQARIISTETVEAKLNSSDLLRLGLSEDYRLSDEERAIIAAMVDVDVPIATKEAPGVVKVGDRLNIDTDGTLSAQEAETLSNTEIENLLEAMAQEDLHEIFRRKRFTLFRAKG